MQKNNETITKSAKTRCLGDGSKRVSAARQCAGDKEAELGGSKGEINGNHQAECRTG